MKECYNCGFKYEELSIDDLKRLDDSISAIIDKKKKNLAVVESNFDVWWSKNYSHFEEPKSGLPETIQQMVRVIAKAAWIASLNQDMVILKQTNPEGWHTITSEEKETLKNAFKSVKPRTVSVDEGGFVAKTKLCWDVSTQQVLCSNCGRSLPITEKGDGRAVSSYLCQYCSTQEPNSGIPETYPHKPSCKCYDCCYPKP